MTVFNFLIIKCKLSTVVYIRIQDKYFFKISYLSRVEYNMVVLLYHLFENKRQYFSLEDGKFSSKVLLLLKFKKFQSV